ncbi:MAG: nucleotidyl transferase AbiEii/AbiGii toxin family protein [Muribaculaceae bacterium]|nr:nucleotidyl transferase AbiEii/AbiGii toxin family protein [Muribaculaceae bacterium]
MPDKYKGLTSQTHQLILPLSLLDCIKPFTLVGGTALALQLGTRESEDLDFMTWRKNKNEIREVDWPAIKKELEKIGNIEKMELYDLDHVEFIVDGVKLSFYANPNYSPVEKPVPFLNNIVLADLKAIGAMKMEVMMRRSKFRDYYDIYSLLVAGMDLNEMIGLALNYSGHKLKSKNLLAMITNSNRFRKDELFKNLNPIYDVDSKDIEDKIISFLK